MTGDGTGRGDEFQSAGGANGAMTKLADILEYTTGPVDGDWMGQRCRRLLDKWRDDSEELKRCRRIFLKNGGVLLCSEMFSDDFLPKVDLGSRFGEHESYRGPLGLKFSYRRFIQIPNWFGEKLL